MDKDYELAKDYVRDTQNLYWPGTVNRSHVFDLFAEHLPHHSGSQTHLDMINFVSDNRERYMLISHVILKIYEINLNVWENHMTYWENSADELALYALSDLTKRHTVVLTCTKPWSTVHPDVAVNDIHHLLELCDVKLLSLGGNKFGLLCHRPQNYDTTAMVNLPVFPGIEPPSDREMDTAYSLLLMNNSEKSASQLDQQEPPANANTNVSDYTDLALDLPDLTGLLKPLSSNDTTENFTDAMEYVVGRALIGTPTLILKVPDAADSLFAEAVLVETSDTPETNYVLVKPQTEERLKRCSVELMRIDSMLSYVPKKNLCQTLMHAGRPHTCSMCTPKSPK